MIAAGSAQTPNFILPNGTIVIELVLFVVVIGLVNALVLKPVQSALTERAERIRASHNASDAGASEAAALDAEARRVLDAARAEARELLEGATRAVEASRAEAQSAGLAEHDRLLAAALAEIAAQRSAVRSEILGSAEQLVCDAAARIVGVAVDPVRHRELIDATIAAATRPATANEDFDAR